ARRYRAQVGGFQRERFEEVLDLLNRFDWWVICGGFADEPAADRTDRTMRDLQSGPPGRLERHFSSRFREGRGETADSRFAASSGDSDDELGEAIEPRIEHNDAGELEDATECGQRQYAVGIIKLSPHPVCCCR